MSKWVYLNNGFVQEENAVLSYRDLAIQRGYGIFDFLRVSRNLPVFMEEHLDRFFSSSGHMHLPIKQDRETLRALIGELIKRNNLPESGVRLTLTGGDSPDGYSIAEPSLVISQHLFAIPGQEQFEKGIRLVSFEHQRQLPEVKTIDYAKAIWLQPYIRQNGGEDVLYHTAGKVTECPRANFFIVTKDDRLVTPAKDILKGITRKRLLGLASDYMTVEERDIRLKEVFEAKEAFITSTTKQILPVVQLDAHQFPSEKRFAKLLSQRLMSALTGHIHQPAE